MPTRVRLLPSVALLAACAAPPPPAPPAPAAPPAPPPAAAAHKSLPPGVTEAETRHGATQNGKFVVWWTSEPSPVPLNAPFSLRVWAARVAAPDTPLVGAHIDVSAQMPEHGHGMERTPRITPQPDGSTLVEGLLFHMRGHWDIVINVQAAGTFGQAILPVYLP